MPTDAPEADGTPSWDTTTVVLAQAHAGGTVGTGTLAGVVQARDTPDAGGAFDAMVKAVRNAGRPGAAGYAISAADVALWDLKARLPDLPPHRLLGAVRETVPVYGSGGFTTYDERQLREQLTHRTAEQAIPG